MKPMPASHLKKNDGFTFVELLVVLAMLAILSVMLLPAIAGTKPNSQSFQCMNNQRELTLGWQMYARTTATSCHRMIILIKHPIVHRPISTRCIIGSAERWHQLLTRVFLLN
jgi:prepilin-type N-terminal cleavage/methylation domain-containing protein